MGTLMPLVEQKLLTLPGHLSSHSILMRLVLLSQTNNNPLLPSKKNPDYYKRSAICPECCSITKCK